MAKTVDNHYIRERVLKSGKTSLLIEIRMDGQTFRQSLKVEEYGGLSQCYKVARKIRDKKLVEMREGRYIKHSPTVGELYAEKFELLKVRASTKKKHDIVYRMAVQDYAAVPIDKITTSDIQKTINKYSATHTYKMVEKLLSIWRQIYQCAAMKNLPVPDRTIGVTINRDHCKKDVHRKKNIQKADFDAFCEALLKYNEWDEIGRYRSRCIYYALQIMAYCGTQPAETYALCKEDFHLEDDIPHISINKCIGTDFWESEEDNIAPVLRNAKTEYRNRDIPLNDVILDICRELLEWTKYDQVFADYNGSLMETGYICTYIRNVSQKCGIPFTQYMLRHNFSSDLFSQKMNPAVIRDLMGHSSKSTAQTLDYAVTSEKDRKKAIQRRKLS